MFGEFQFNLPMCYVSVGQKGHRTFGESIRSYGVSLLKCTHTHRESILDIICGSTDFHLMPTCGSVKGSELSTPQ